VLKVPVKTGPKHLDLAHASGYAPYTIRKNDSDWKIANMFHMAPKVVRTLNPNVAWKSPKPGTVIRIPMKNAFIYKLASIPVIRSTHAIVKASNTIVRAAPGSHAKRVTMVNSGRWVRVLDRSEHWYKVKFEYGTIGWVRGDLLKAVQPKVYAKNSASGKTTSKSKSRTPRLASNYRPKPRTGRSSRAGGYRYPKLPTGGMDMMAFALSMRGTPYRYGAASRSGTDCSGFALQVLRHEGVKLPRTAAQQSRKGQRVSKSELKPGDLVFFHTSRGSRITHVGIYQGNGKFIHASSGRGRVRVDSLNEGYYKRRLATARRVVKLKSKDTKKADPIAKAKKEDNEAMKAAEKQIQQSDAVGK
jgi:cell wall-associated NlpC family hydrolase